MNLAQVVKPHRCRFTECDTDRTKDSPCDFATPAETRAAGGCKLLTFGLNLSITHRWMYKRNSTPAYINSSHNMSWNFKLTVSSGGMFSSSAL